MNASKAYVVLLYLQAIGQTVLKQKLKFYKIHKNNVFIPNINTYPIIYWSATLLPAYQIKVEDYFQQNLRINLHIVIIHYKKETTVLQLKIVKKDVVK